MPSFWHGRSYRGSASTFRDGYAIGTGAGARCRLYQRIDTADSDIDVTYVSMLMTQRFASVGRPTIGYGKYSGWRTGVSRCDDAPRLLLQAEEERVVDNPMHDCFCELRTAAGHPVEGGRPLVIKGAYHAILLKRRNALGHAPRYR